jgi:DegV family protein with EDD domain
MGSSIGVTGCASFTHPISPSLEGRDREQGSRNMSIAVVTDSTSDLPADLAAKHGITVVPLNVHFGLQSYQDGVTIKADEFYERLASGGELPKTSQPSVGTFVETYQQVAETHDQIISVHLSHKVSATYNSAVQAAREVEGDVRIEVIDTLQASMALGLVAVGVAKRVADGASFDEAVDAARRMSPRAKFLGLVETLEYLQKGGRIGKAQALVGSLLRIKPLLGLVDGEAHAIDRVRTRAKGIDRVVEMVAENAPLESLCVLYTTEPDVAAGIVERVRPIGPSDGVLTAQLGPVVGTYLGPGMLGIALVRADGG